jgi:RNA polymerase sigma factor (sigma-70 family)
VLLSRSPDSERYTESQRLILLEALSIIVVGSLVAENIRRAEASEKVTGRSIRQWIAAGEPTPEELRTLLRHGQRPRYNPDGREETDAMYRTALVERVDAARQEHFNATLEEQFLHFWTGYFERVPRRADSSVRDQIRALRSQRGGEVSTDFDEPTSKEASAHIIDGLSVALAKVPGTEPRLLAELRERASLTKREREVIELYLQDLPQVEIAERLQITQQRVSQLTRQAIKKMQEHARSHP